MLTVAAPSSGTEAERAAHRLFTQWDTGVRVLGGVAAFRPYEDPATGRRQSDVVLLVPDGVIVVRLIGSQRQKGPIVAHPRGAWSIGGEVLRIAGGGSNPLPALRSAQAAVASTLRASGLEPGQVAMLVAVGAGEPVDPSHGRLDDGVVVCPISEEGLAVGVRRAAALTAAADVRQWTTADIKAALTSLGATGRIPAVEELNSEGFMYSPYVLRRPDLVAAATAVAAASAADPGVNTADQPPPTGVPDESGQPTQVAVGDDLADNDMQDGDVRDDDIRDDDIRDDYRGAVDHDRDRVEADDRADVDHGLGAIFGADLAPARSAPRTRDIADSADPRRAGPRGPGRSDERPRDDQKGRRYGLRILAALVALLLAGAAVYVGIDLLGSGDPAGGADPDAVGSSTAVQTTTPAESAEQIVGERSYLLAVSRAGESCTGNAFGQVADYFVTTDCVSLDRELYTTDLDGVEVIVSVARVTMPDEATAGELKVLADTNGTGNVDDLIRAGERIPNGPTELDASAYASDLDGLVLTIVVAAWLDPANRGDEQALDQLAAEALALEPAA